MEQESHGRIILHEQHLSAESKAEPGRLGRFGRIMPQLGPEIWHSVHCLRTIYDKKQPKRIGEHRVAVPDRFFKVVLIYNRKSPIVMGFLFDNKAHHQALEKYMVSVDSVEKVTGMDFFSKLPDDVENQIEADIPALPSGR